MTIYGDFRNNFQNDSSAISLIEIRAYKGANPHVAQMTSYLKMFLSNDLKGAYVHGSLGTQEEIRYSDFDALVLIKEEVFHNPKRLAEVAEKLFRGKSIMYRFDPLQHHGWFVLPQAEGINYPEHSLPIHSLKFIRSLLPNKNHEIRIKQSPSAIGYDNPLHRMTRYISHKISQRKYPKNIFQLKSFLSQFMLLPALYIQARDGHGVFKKFSFELARKDFDSNVWKIMDEVSEVRENWQYRLDSVPHYIMCRNTYFSRLYAKKLAPAIPQELRVKLQPQFFERMNQLTMAFSERIEN